MYVNVFHSYLCEDFSEIKAFEEEGISVEQEGISNEQEGVSVEQEGVSVEQEGVSVKQESHWKITDVCSTAYRYPNLSSCMRRLGTSVLKYVGHKAVQFLV